MTALHGHAERPRPRPTPPEVSVVVPLYANEATLIELLDRLERALTGESYELVLVVDGSPDGSLALLRAEVERRPRLVVLELARNCGQHGALCAGFEAARGAVICVLDADLQISPEELPRFLAGWRDGHDFVSGRRTVRHDPLRRRLASFCLNRLARFLTGRRLADWGCPIAAIDRSLVEAVPAQGEKRRFLKPLVAELSRDAVELDVEGKPSSGASSYSFLALTGVALDFAVAFSTRPFHRLAGLGFATFGAACVGGALYLALRIGHVIPPSPPAQVALALAALVGLQVLVLGAAGEYTHRTYRSAQGRPLFEVARRYERDPADGPVDGPAHGIKRA